MREQFKKQIVMVLAVLMVVGCMSTKRESVNQALLRKMREAQLTDGTAKGALQGTAVASSDPASASLWGANGNNRYVFRDGKAQGVGDLVTVVIVEESKASSKGTTDVKKDSTFDGTLSPFGLSDAGKGKGWDKADWGKILSAATKNNYKGEGTTDRSGSLSARITAVVEAVLPNGNFYIKGSKVVTINNEDQNVTMSGFVRPDDIRLDNTVLSTLVADAEIAYSGEGVIGDKQRPGWLARFLDWVWPF